MFSTIIKTGLGGMLLILLSTKIALAGNNEYQQWLKQQSQGFQEYKDSRDREFTQFLKSHWIAIELAKGKVADTTPKPLVMPVADLKEVLPESSNPQNKAPEPVLIHLNEQTVIKKPVPEIVSGINNRGKQVNVDFFGQKLSFYYDPAMASAISSRLDKDSISQYWSRLSKSDYEAILAQLGRQKKALQLTDWAYASLVDKLSIAIHQSSDKESVLLAWFLLTKTGYQSRVAYNNQSVYLLMPSEQEMFDTPYFSYSGRRYYAVSFDGRQQSPGQVYTYKGEYPQTVDDLDMKVTENVATTDKLEKRHLSFEYQGKRYNIEASYDRGRIAFFKSYPQLELAMYFSAGVDKQTSQPLLKQLAAYMQGMTQQQAVNFLLRFVQVSLKYGTDEQQFGRENYLFPEETLFYPYSDCEDRAVLFAWLVKSLLGLEVIGLDYPGHVATAVHFTDKVAGDSISYRGQTYTVADPTYVNAKAGMTMPDYKNIKPALITY